MNYKLLIYAFDIMLCIFATSAIHFEKFVKKNKVTETRILAFIISLILAYLLSNFIFDLLEISKVL